MPAEATICTAVVLLAVGFTTYVVFVYPLLLTLMRRRWSRPVRRGAVERPVSIIIAVYNGAAFLEAKLRSILASDYPRQLMEILVVSDGSTDGTDRIAQSMEGAGVRLIRIPHGGKASALNAGMAAATGEFLVLTDVRQALHPSAITRMMENFADPSVGVVSGALKIANPATHEEVSTSLYWRYEFWIRDNLAAIDSIFGASGALYAMRRELAVALPGGTLLDDMYLPLAAFFRGYRLVVEPSAEMYDFPTAVEVEFRRKVRTLAGNYQILAAYPGLLGPSNRLWLHFMSYKFGRLLVPFALLAGFGCSFGLPSPWWEWAIGVHLVAFGWAALDRLVPERSPLKRVTAPLWFVVTLMAAGVVALSILFVPGDRLWTETKVTQRAA
jgi:poly-beta-1,6-N-acetyl-D-glucosamine synthase